LTKESLVRVNADMRLGAMNVDLRGTNIGNLKFGPLLDCAIGLDRCSKSGQCERANHRD